MSSEWEEAVDPATLRTYEFNRRTRERRWSVTRSAPAPAPALAASAVASSPVAVAPTSIETKILKSESTATTTTLLTVAQDGLATFDSSTLFAAINGVLDERNALEHDEWSEDSDDDNEVLLRARAIARSRANARAHGEKQMESSPARKEVLGTATSSPSSPPTPGHSALEAQSPAGHGMFSPAAPNAPDWSTLHLLFG